MTRLYLQKCMVLLAMVATASASGSTKEQCDSANPECVEDDASLLSLHHHKQKHDDSNGKSKSVNVYVMMSLTMVSRDGTLLDPDELYKNLTKIKETGATGVMADVWWGITEPEPSMYNFEPYKQFFQMCEKLGLEVQIVTSFHQCCDESQPSCFIPLPYWITKEEGIWYKNTLGDETKAYISLFADNETIGGCRTPLQMYGDWLKAFKAATTDFKDTIVEVMLGMGTDGELKYPSYENPPAKWKFPGIGMYQASDQYALASLKAAATAKGKPEAWASPPPSSQTGDYNAFPEHTKWFREFVGGYQTGRGKFFQRWYSNALTDHGTNMLTLARQIFGSDMRISGKIAGVHWWYKTASHAAELNAGFYNANGVDGYGNIARSFASAEGAIVDFTCLEMTDASQNSSYKCGPQELVQQVMGAARAAKVPFTGENALGFYDAGGYKQMITYKPPAGYLESVTYLRMTDDLLEPENLKTFTQFVNQMQDRKFVTPFSMA